MSKAITHTIEKVVAEKNVTIVMHIQQPLLCGQALPWADFAVSCRLTHAWHRIPRIETLIVAPFVSPSAITVSGQSNIGNGDIIFDNFNLVFFNAQARYFPFIKGC